MKTILLLAFVLIPFFGFSQNYKCIFERIKNGTITELEITYHTLNSSTSINYYEDGYEINLGTIFEDNTLNYFITIYKKSVFVAEFDLWSTESNPSEFLANYKVQGFAGQCECKLQE